MRHLLLASAAATTILVGLAVHGAASAQPGAGPYGSYQQSCANVHTAGGVLTADCTDRSGQTHTSSLNLAHCRGDIGNQNGLLACDTIPTGGGTATGSESGRARGGGTTGGTGGGGRGGSGQAGAGQAPSTQTAPQAQAMNTPTAAATPTAPVSGSGRPSGGNGGSRGGGQSGGGQTAPTQTPQAQPTYVAPTQPTYAQPTYTQPSAPTASNSGRGRGGYDGAQGGNQSGSGDARQPQGQSGYGRQGGGQQDRQRGGSGSSGYGQQNSGPQGSYQQGYSQQHSTQGSYQQTCRNVRTGNGQLSADCADVGGNFHSSTLSYTQCSGDIGNRNGVLVCSGAVASISGPPDNGRRQDYNAALLAGIFGAVIGAAAAEGDHHPDHRLYQPGYAYPAYGDTHYGDPRYDPRYAQGGFGYGHQGQFVAIADRAGWLNDRIDRSVRDGDLGRGEARGLRTELDDLVDREARYRRQGMRPWMMSDLDKRFDDLAARVSDARHDGRGYDNGRPSDGYRH